LILGIAVTKEQFATKEVTNNLLPESQCFEYSGVDVVSSGSQPESLNKSSTPAGSTRTEEMFMEADLEKIQVLGELEHWIVPAGMVNMNDTILGVGSFGVVFDGEYCGSPIAVKFPKNPAIDNDADTLTRVKSILHELRMYRRLRHQHIALFHGAMLFNGQPALVLEKIRGQSLTIFVHQANMSMLWKTSMILDLLSAVWYLHEQKPPIVHGDLKPNNMMVEIRIPNVGSGHLLPHLKLLDFGLSRVLGRRPRSMGGTEAWIAPEVCELHKHAATSADMYSVGCIMFFILTRRTPANHRQIHESLRRPLHWPAETGISEHALICERCVCLDAEARPSASLVHLQMFALLDKQVAGIAVKRN